MSKAVFEIYLMSDVSKFVMLVKNINCFGSLFKKTRRRKKFSNVGLIYFYFL